MEDIKILEAVERYIAGQMGPDERVYFEQLRKSNPEVDQLVVEHTFFLQQLNRFDEVRQLKNTLNDTHIHLAERGLIKSPRLEGRAKVVYLFNKYKRVAAIAACIAGLTVLTIFALIWSFAPVKPANKEDVIELNRKFDNINRKVQQIQTQNQALDQKINDVKDQTNIPPIEYKSGGTGFLIDTKGYLVTNAHVIENEQHQQAQHVAVENSSGNVLTAEIVYKDDARDIAILKITDKTYKAPTAIPYSIKNYSADLAESIFTLGYPRNDIVYGDGYIAAKTGYHEDTLSCQITIPANPGNSGSPILNRNGEIIGIVSGKEKTTEGVVFAMKSKNIFAALNQLQKDSAYQNVKLPTLSTLKGVDRLQQVKKISDYIYMVKVD